MKKISTTRRIISAVCILSASVAILYIFLLGTRAIQYAQQQHTRIFDIAHQETTQTTQYINKYLKNSQELADSLAQKLSLNQLSQDALLSELEKKPNSISGLGVISNSPEPSYHYYVEKDDKQKLIQVITPDKKNAFPEWFTALYEQQKGFTKPIIDPNTGFLSIMYIVPWKGSSGHGVVFATQSIPHLTHILNTLSLGKKGYWILADSGGRILYHPDSTLSLQKPLLVEVIAKQLGMGSMQSLQKEITQGATNTNYQNEVNGEPSLIFTDIVPANKMVLAGVFGRTEMYTQTETDQKRHISMQLTIAVVFLLVILLLLMTLTAYGDTKQLWTASSLIGIILLSGIINLWYAAHKYPAYNNTAQPIENKSELYQYLDEYQKKLSTLQQTSTITDSPEDKLEHLLGYRYRAGRYIPTGFLINDIGLINADQLEFVGYIWQRYFDKTHDGISRGFILPQLAEKPVITEVSRIKQGRTETIIWQVTATLNQTITYKNYPFDLKNFQIVLQHKDFDKNIVLVPDLDAYRFLMTSTKPGIGAHSNLMGWYTTGSYFSMESGSYQTNFGVYSYGPFGLYQQLDKSNIPLLGFNILAKRGLFEIIINNLLPLLVIFIILFILIMTYMVQGFGWTMSTCAGTFFSAILAHANFRKNIPSNEFVYFESLYFILYSIIFLILIMALTSIIKNKFDLSHYHEYLSARLLYWPLVLGAFFIATVLYLF